MTGEMTLAGQVLPVGGLKEKILAAHRAGIKKILAPMGCKPDIEHNVRPSFPFLPSTTRTDFFDIDRCPRPSRKVSRLFMLRM